MAKMRATRVGQMQAGAEAAARRQAARGAHARLREGDSLEALLRDAEDPSPIVLHLATDADETSADACLFVEEVLRKAASSMPFARLVTEMRPDREAPPCLPPTVGPLPALLVVERGRVTASCAAPWAELRAEQIRDTVSKWLEHQKKRLSAVERKRANGDLDESDEEEEVAFSYCGRPGCRAYAHEHADDGRLPGSAFEGDPFLRYSSAPSVRGDKDFAIDDHL